MPEDRAAKRTISVALVEQEIRRFLSTSEAEAICITGHWGVGKTFAWKRFLEEAGRDKKIELKRYSYVSLFGVNSLDELKYSIFENSVQSSAVECQPSLETLKTNTVAVAGQIGKKSIRFIQQLPKVKGYVGGLGPLWFMAVKSMIVCIDDIERHGKDLRLVDVLGLISVLKEQKQCKVVLILNDEALDVGGDKADFQTYLEKVVDTFLRFTPSAEECVRIALPSGTQVSSWLAESCVALRISNIRVIRKIERAVGRIEPLLKDFDPQVLNNTVRSLALLGWCVYEPAVAPSLEYLEGRAEAIYSPKKKDSVSEKEAAWNVLLDALGFTIMDEYDKVLLDGVQKGFFDPDAIRKFGSEQDKSARMYKSENLWKEAWRTYHDSFADNQPEVVDAIYQGFLREVQHRTHLDLNGAVTILKSLGESQKAGEVIKIYLARPGWTRDSMDLRIYPFANMIDDVDVIQAINDKYATFSDDVDPIAVVLHVAKQRGWSENDLKVMASLSSDDYYRMFKEHRGAELRAIIEGCLQFAAMQHPTELMTTISLRAKEALQRIGRESTINALRVKKFGFEVDS